MSARIGLMGFYGMHNLGDEAVLEGLLRALEGAVPGVRTTVYPHGPGAVALHACVEVRHVRLRNIGAMLRAVREMDALVIGGGGILHDYRLGSPLRYLLWAMAARLGGKPVMLACVGVGPIRTRLGAAQIRATAALANVVTVRDEASARRLRTIGVRKAVSVLADPALIICPDRPDHAARGSGPAAFVLRQWPPMRGEPVAPPRLLAAAVDATAQRLGCGIALVPFDSPRDDSFCEAVRGMMEHATSARVAPRPASPRAAIEELAQARLVVSMRLHALILATAAGVPVVALACDEKISSFMAATGREEHCLPVETLDPRRLAATCEAAIAKQAESARRIAESFRELQTRAGKITGILRDFLAR